jgi:hypothetical protein
MIDSKEQSAQAGSLILPPFSSESFASRRQVIGTLGLVITAFCASAGSASAMWKWGSNDDVPVVKVKTIPSDARVGKGSVPSQQVGGFPEEWVRLQGRNLKNYTNYLNSLKLRNISAQDVIAAHAKERGSVWNMLPPREWWTRMGYTLRVVDRISSEMQTPVKEIVSAYRSPAYNARCGGARRKSWHQANVAVDVQFDTSARKVTSATRSLRDRGLFKGGVGSYSSFTHIDTRGTNVNW